ncbi:MAG: alpha/beta fold hydrolase [Pigmentiphaga sp.]
MEASFEQAQASAIMHTVLCNGAPMRWRQWGAGPVLLLIHGNSGSWTHWVRNVLPLARHYTVLAPDLPGHGDSAPPVGEVSCAAFATLLWQGVDQLIGSDTGLSLAGFSLGSLLVESMAMQQPERVRQVLLLRGGFSAGLPVMPALRRWRGVADPAEAEQIHRHNLQVSMIHDPDRIEDSTIALHADNLQRCTLDVRLLIGSRQLDAFTGLRCPVHGIAGEFDVYGGNVAQQGEALRKTLPQATFEMVPKAGHWAAYERADRVNAILLAALAGQAA